MEPCGWLDCGALKRPLPPNAPLTFITFYFFRLHYIRMTRSYASAIYLPCEVVEKILNFSMRKCFSVEDEETSHQMSCQQKLFKYALVSKTFANAALPLLYRDPFFAGLGSSEAADKNSNINVVAASLPHGNSMTEKTTRKVMRFLKTVLENESYFRLLRTFDFNWFEGMSYTCLNKDICISSSCDSGIRDIIKSPITFDVDQLGASFNGIRRLRGNIPLQNRLGRLFKQCIMSPKLTSINLVIMESATLALLASELCQANSLLQRVSLDFMFFKYDALKSGDEVGYSEAHLAPAAAVSRIITSSPLLKHMSIRALLCGFAIISDSLVSLTRFKSLHLIDCDLNGDRIQLRDLSDNTIIEEGPFSKEFMKKICPNLQEMKLEACRGINDAILIPLFSSCTSLRDLKLRWTHATQEALVALIGCQLKASALKSSDSAIDLSEDMSKTSKTAGPALEKLVLNGAFSESLTGRSLTLVSLCTNLKVLALSDTTFDVSCMDHVLISIGNQLTHLQLINGFDGVPIHDLNLAIIGKYCHHLSHLDVSFSGCTEAGLETMLTDLDVASCTLRELILVYCSFIRVSIFLSSVFDHCSTSHMKNLDLRRCTIGADDHVLAMNLKHSCKVLLSDDLEE